MSDYKKSLLVIINPASGTKIAMKMYIDILKPALDSNNMNYELLETQYAGHARNAIQKENLKDYIGIIIISGDGLIHEVFNGLYNLPDWVEVMDSLPVGIMPGGSGNALNCALLYQMKQPFDGMNKLGTNGALENIMSGIKHNRTTSLDFIEVETDEKRVITFLGVTMGLIADVDLGTEFLRFLGYMRAYLAVIWKIIFPKSYYLKLWYLPLPLDKDGKPIGVTSDTPKINLPKLDEPAPSDWVSEEGEYYLVYITKCSLIDPITLLAPDSKLDDGISWLITIKSTFTRKDMIKWLLNTQDAAHVGLPGVRVIPVQAFRIEPVSPEDGFLSVDAESYNFKPVQGQILPNKAHLLSAN